MPCRCRKIERWGSVAVFVCLASLAAVGETPARAGSEAPRASVRVGARSDYSESRGKASRHEALVLSTKLSSDSTKGHLSKGALVEYRLRDDGSHLLLAGGMFDFTRARWSLAASPFYQRSLDGRPGQWRYWGNVRRRLTPRQSLGLEIYGSADTGKPSKWLLAYSGTVSKSLAVSFALGAGVDSGPDLATRTIVTWRLGGRR